MLGFMALDISYCGVTVVLDCYWVLWLCIITLIHQLLVYQSDDGFYWCIRLMLGFMALETSFCGVTD